MRSKSDHNRVQGRRKRNGHHEGILRYFSDTFHLSIATGDLIQIDGAFYVTHSGLLRLAARRHCCGINVSVLYSDPAASKWVVQATVFPVKGSIGFSGLGDADPSNVHPEFHGCELRIAETRAVNRALRKAYGIGLCSVEEHGAPPPTPTNGGAQNPPVSSPALEVVCATPLREQLRRLIRENELDPDMVKKYALQFCLVKSLRQASREQISAFLKLLRDRLSSDRAGLLADLLKLSIDQDASNQEAA